MGEIEQLPGVSKGSQLFNWLREAIHKVEYDEMIKGILNVIMQCGSVLALDKSMPQLQVNGLTICSQKIYKKCRGRLQAVLKDKASRHLWHGSRQRPQPHLTVAKVGRMSSDRRRLAGDACPSAIYLCLVLWHRLRFLHANQ